LEKKIKNVFAPPTISIYDTDPELISPKSTFSPEHEQSIIRLSETNNGIRSAISPQPQDIIFKDNIEKNEQNDDRWVVVFGFPQQATSTVLKQFQKYGDIVRYRAGEGNWINIQYQTRLQAQKALSKNGKIIDDGLMIGVVPNSNKKRIGVSTPLLTPFAIENKSVPINANNYSVEPMLPKTLPIPSNSMWSKVTEYIFGF